MIQQIPDFIPAIHRHSVAGKAVNIASLPRPVKRRLRTAERIKVSDHAERFRKVTDGAHVGSWRHEHAPHTVKIMDTFGLPHVREVWFCGVEQSGKTNTMLNCLHWAIDCDPGNTFYIMPTEDTMAKITGGKIKPMVMASPRLSGYLTGRQDDITMSRIQFSHGVTVFPAYANSASALASWSAKYCFGDEVDKYPELVGKETDPITLIRKRTRTYKGRYKRMFASTPAGRFVYSGMERCKQVWEYAVRCPDCGKLLRMDADHLDLPDNADPDNLDPAAIRYACQHCGSIWDDIRREQAIRAGRWRCKKGEELPRPSTVGFHHRAWECLDVSLYEIAVAWLRNQIGDMAHKIGWANGYEAIDYITEQQDRQEEQILRLVDESMPRGIVPPNPCCIALLVDTQRIGFHYQVWAYGWGRDLNVWVIDHGYVEHYRHLQDMAARAWLDAAGNSHKILAAFIDSGGGTNPGYPKHSRTAEVYEFCRQNPMFHPLKGQRNPDLPWNVSRLEFYPSRTGQKIPIPGGLSLYKLHVTMYKNDLARKLLVEPGGMGGINLHAEVGDDFARQLCAEYQDDHGWWQCPKSKANHHWDLGVYGMAAADILGVRNALPPEPEQEQAAKKKKQENTGRW